MSDVDVLRRFNRTYTQRIGALDESFLGLGMPLSTARVLHEVAGRGDDGTAVTALRETLGLDSGYLSRTLRDLEARGLVVTDPDPDDGRRRVVALTEAGRATYGELEARSQARAETLLADLTERQRERLAEALSTADLLVRAATVTLCAVDPARPAARAAVEAYVAELVDRFPDGFDPAPTPPLPYFALATSDEEAVACGGLREIGPSAGEVKRMWVSPGWRGSGLGSRVLRHLEAAALQRGLTELFLDTHGGLTEAIAMYERAGYERVERYNDNPYAQLFFRKQLRAAPGSPR